MSQAYLQGGLKYGFSMSYHMYGFGHIRLALIRYREELYPWNAHLPARCITASSMDCLGLLLYISVSRRVARIPEHREVMAGRSGNHEKMPDQVAVAQARIGQEKRHAAGVCQTSRKQPQQARRRNFFKQGVDSITASHPISR